MNKNHKTHRVIMKYTFSKIHIYRCLPPYSKWYRITTDSGITKDNIVIVGKKRLLKVAFALILMVLFNKRTTITR